MADFFWLDEEEGYSDYYEDCMSMSVIMGLLGLFWLECGVYLSVLAWA